MKVWHSICGGVSWESLIYMQLKQAGMKQDSKEVSIVKNGVQLLEWPLGESVVNPWKHVVPTQRWVSCS